ncbi:hypothetical protein DD238_005982 [Peronospora effusa]|uniref:Uncharacterized protein n=1 Tax=Peronospora effusa TaxID=542832 RepID=A0A3M6VBM5_9STRA|nr:hypothetical protein DD238_005982 [Peronospora effusa]
MSPTPFEVVFNCSPSATEQWISTTRLGLTLWSDTFRDTLNFTELTTSQDLLDILEWFLNEEELLEF